MFYLLARISLWREIFLSTTMVSKWHGSPDIKRNSYIPGPANDNQEDFLLEGRKSNLCRYNLHSEVYPLKLIVLWVVTNSYNHVITSKMKIENISIIQKKLSVPLNSLPKPRPWKQVISFISTYFCFFPKCHINGMMYFVALWVWFLSLPAPLWSYSIN